MFNKRKLMSKWKPVSNRIIIKKSNERTARIAVEEQDRRDRIRLRLRGKIGLQPLAIGGLKEDLLQCNVPLHLARSDKRSPGAQGDVGGIHQRILEEVDQKSHHRNACTQ